MGCGSVARFVSRTIAHRLYGSVLECHHPSLLPCLRAGFFRPAAYSSASSPGMRAAYPRYRSDKTIPSASSRSWEIFRDFWNLAVARSTSSSKGAPAPRTISALAVPTSFPVGGTRPGFPRRASPRPRFPRETAVCPRIRSAKAYRVRLSSASVLASTSSPWN
jgi:hypothetical protein